jgi:hypothetical protein
MDIYKCPKSVSEKQIGKNKIILLNLDIYFLKMRALCCKTVF